MRFKTINPATGEIIAEYETMTRPDVMRIAECSHAAFLKWRGLGVSERAPYFRRFASVLRKNNEHYARTMTTEMGKPIREARAEVEKCAWTSEVFAEKASEWLREETIEADGLRHIVAFEPLGVILSVMPWNFPFWQALRFGIPGLMAGNGSVLKHSNLCPQCALAIEGAFREAGFPENLFRAVIADHQGVAELAQSDIVQGISLTGSTEAGARIAELAGRNLKKVVLELGGSDPFIVLDDADIEFTARNAVLGRALNTGQSCIASKRFIVVEPIARSFSRRFAELMGRLRQGDPMDERTEVGPLAGADALREIEAQVEDAVRKGARVLAGGRRLGRKGYFYMPTVLVNTTADMRVVREEVFGPVAPVIVVRDEEEAVRVANSSEFGLGGSVWTRNLERGLAVARRVQSGTLFVNSITKSDPRVPFGGVKKSGFGRELCKYGLREFVNVKALSVYRHG
jgi:acyl-CoA reductase-like NAD-dependent aldehyde dehydrogenase